METPESIIKRLLKKLDKVNYYDQVFKTSKYQNQKITYLKLNNMKINHLSSDLFQNGLTNLTHLEMDFNEIEEIPDQLFDSITNLKYLSICNNKIRKLQKNVFSKLINLKKLYIINNLLDTIEEQVFTPLTKLTELLIGTAEEFNSLKSLDETIFYGLINLERLQIGNNKLTKLPPTIFRDQSNLLTLDLSFNNLNELPPMIFQSLISLEKLILSGNQLISLPISFWKLNNLKIIDLSDNPLSVGKNGYLNDDARIQTFLKSKNLNSLNDDNFISRIKDNIGIYIILLIFAIFTVGT